MPDIPSDSIFAAHGLYDVELDIGIPDQSLFDPIASAGYGFTTPPPVEFFSGSARLIPHERYPVISDAITIPPRVRFSFCPAYSTAPTTARFRRRAQILALGTLPTSPGPSLRFGRVEEVIAWWEDGLGLWFVVREDPSKTVSLLKKWSVIMGDPDMEDVVATQEILPMNAVRRARMSPRDAETAYGQISKLLNKVVKCLQVRETLGGDSLADLQALHQRDLSALACRPSCFEVTDTDIVYFTRFDNVLPLPRFNLRERLGSSPLSQSLLFQRNPLDQNDSQLDEPTLRKNLRYLAPEEALTKRTSGTGDIYSFGVLAYEMLTGTIIDGGPDSPDDTDVDVLTDFHRHVTMQIPPPIEVLQREAQLGAISVTLPPTQLEDIIMRSLGKDGETRYVSLEALAYDLWKLGRLCSEHGDLAEFEIGEADRLSGFRLPDRPIHRDNQLKALHKEFSKVSSSEPCDGDKSGVTTRVVNVTGLSGSGKTRVLRQFALEAQSLDVEKPCVGVWAKLEKSIHPPLHTFTQLFQALLDRFLADPSEDVKAWDRSIREALGPRFPLFTALLPNAVSQTLRREQRPASFNRYQLGYAERHIHLVSFLWRSHDPIAKSQLVQTVSTTICHEADASDHHA